MARLWGMEFGVFDQTPPKMGSSARPYGPRCSIFFPPRNYNSQSIDSVLWALPLASLGAFARKHNPNVSSALQALPFECHKCPGLHFSPFDIHLAVLDVPRLTPTVPSVLNVFVFVVVMILTVFFPYLIVLVSFTSE